MASQFIVLKKEGKINMENLNYKMAQASLLIDQSLQDLPVGIAYLILENKTNQIKQLYLQQVQREIQTIEQQQEEQSKTEEKEETSSKE